MPNTTSFAQLKPVPIAFLSAEDLACDGYDISKLSQDDLVIMATEMSGAYYDGAYWQELMDAATRLNVPRAET